MQLSHVVKSLFVAIGVSAISIVAYAQDLTIVNNTSQFSTSKINSSPFCSSMFGDWGITKPKSTNVIKDIHLKQACAFHKTDCKANIYMSKNCSGEVIGTVVFDVNKGTQSFNVINNKYEIISAPNSFNFVLNEVN